MDQQLAAQRLLMALEMYEAGEELKRQALRRQFPEADESAIEALLEAWLAARPGAEAGDAAVTAGPAA